MHNQSSVGLVLDIDFHRQKKWCAVVSYYLIEAIIAEFDPVIISSQQDYDRSKKTVRYLISLEPGFCSPTLRYDPHHDCLKAILLSDPHHNAEQRYRYLFEESGFDYVFGYYKNPFFYHFYWFPEEKFIHTPWAIPDQWISTSQLSVRNTDVMVFGSQSTSGAYDVRNWCREQPGVIAYSHSGCDKTGVPFEEYFSWLQQFDAIVAAGSSDPQYDLVTPKYFEAASAGALLIGQYCKDIPLLGFDESNAVIFTKNDFIDQITHFKNNPEQYLNIREAGRRLIKKRHKISDRIAVIKQIFNLSSRFQHSA